MRKSFRESERPDLILLDLNMALKDGRQTLIEIKSDIQYRDIPVIIFTSSDSKRDVFDAYRHYANAYVIKKRNLQDFVKATKTITNLWFNTVKQPKQRSSF